MTILRKKISTKSSWSFFSLAHIILSNQAKGEGNMRSIRKKFFIIALAVCIINTCKSYDASTCPLTLETCGILDDSPTIV